MLGRSAIILCAAVLADPFIYQEGSIPQQSFPNVGKGQEQLGPLLEHVVTIVGKDIPVPHSKEEVILAPPLPPPMIHYAIPPMPLAYSPPPLIHLEVPPVKQPIIHAMAPQRPGYPAILPTKGLRTGKQNWKPVAVIGRPGRPDFTSHGPLTSKESMFNLPTGSRVRPMLPGEI